MQLTCPVCGLTFETQATTNTRCRRCRKVVNVGVRRSRPATFAVTRDDPSEDRGRTVLGGAVVTGGGAALWHGVTMRRASSVPDSSTGRGHAWLWCALGVVRVVGGVLVVLGSS